MLVSSLMAHYANFSCKLPVASRASLCQGICWWPIGLGFALSALSLSFTDFLCMPRSHMHTRGLMISVYHEIS